jgi:hypothetical protein
MLKFLLSILLLLSLSIGMGNIPPASARTIQFQWSGDSGYQMRGWFAYDEKTAPVVIHEEGAGKTRAIANLSLFFIDREGRSLDRYDNVVDGVSKANYFQVNFDRRTGEFFGAIDLGGESAGENYLKGIVDQDLSLFFVENGDQVVDEDGSPEIVIDFLE